MQSYMNNLLQSNSNLCKAVLIIFVVDQNLLSGEVTKSANFQIYVADCRSAYYLQIHIYNIQI